MPDTRIPRDKQNLLLKSRGRRPSPPPRIPSFTKRHASFDSPREVPLPSPSMPSNSQDYFDVSSGPSRLTKNRGDGETATTTTRHGVLTPPSPSPIDGLSLQQASEALPQTALHTVHPFPRPYSLPHSATTSDFYPAATPGASTVDRSSSASLPLPAQIPFHTLPRIGESRPLLLHTRSGPDVRMLVSEMAKSSVAEEDSAVDSAVSSSSSSSGTLSSAPEQDPSPHFHESHPFKSPRLNGIGIPSSFPSPSAQSMTLPSSPLSRAKSLRTRPLSAGSTSSYPPPEPPTILPPPSPPVNMGTMNAISRIENNNSSGSGSSTSSSPFLSNPSVSTVAKTITNASDLPPVLPPVRARSVTGGESAATAAQQYQFQSNTSSATDANARPNLIANTGVNPNMSPSAVLAQRQASPAPPYAPFLSHMPPPADSWIEVETTPGEYRLNVRLPGFKRDGITLATKRRRILHVVADSWESGGGHFERRISFGYDADLVQVRAEFDGEMLRVVVPRRVPGGMGFTMGMGSLGMVGEGSAGYGMGMAGSGTRTSTGMDRLGGSRAFEYGGMF